MAQIRKRTAGGARRTEGVDPFIHLTRFAATLSFAWFGWFGKVVGFRWLVCWPLASMACRYEGSDLGSYRLRWAKPSLLPICGVATQDSKQMIPPVRPSEVKIYISPTSEYLQHQCGRSIIAVTIASRCF